MGVIPYRRWPVVCDRIGYQSAIGMTMRFRVLRIIGLALLALVGIVAQGCSGDSESATTADSPDAVSPSASSAASAEESPPEVSLLGFDDFDNGESEFFWTGRDALLSSEVVDGELHLKVVEESGIQTLRSTWPPLTAVTLESDITIVARTPGVFTAGCWSGTDQYALAVTGDQRLAVVSRVVVSGDPSVGNAAASLVVLADLGHTSLVRPVGVPFRVRVSCFEQDGDKWIAGWIDDEAIAFVELPDGTDRFDAVGYTASVVSEGDGLVIDNVEISEGYPGGGSHPSTLPPASSNSATTVFSRDGVSFEFPSAWVYFQLPTPAINSSDAWAFGVGPVGTPNVVSLQSLGAQFVSDLEMTPDEFIDEVIKMQVSEGITLRSDPSTIQVGSEDGILFEVENVPDPRTGQPRLVDQVWVFTDTGSYLLTFVYAAESEGELRPIWEQALKTMQGLDQ